MQIALVRIIEDHFVSDRDKFKGSACSLTCDLSSLISQKGTTQQASSTWIDKDYVSFVITATGLHAYLQGCVL